MGLTAQIIQILTLIAAIAAAVAAIMGIRKGKYLIKIDDLQEEIIALKQKNRELAEDRENPLKLVDNFYVDEQNNLFCAGCYVKSRIRVPLTKKDGRGSYHDYLCPVCNASYPQKLTPEEQEERAKSYEWVSKR
jgi:hypothetical protein